MAQNFLHNNQQKGTNGVQHLSHYCKTQFKMYILKQSSISNKQTNGCCTNCSNIFYFSVESRY